MATEINLLDEVGFKKGKGEERDKLLRKEIKGVVEALLFAAKEPLTLQQIKRITEPLCSLSLKALETIVEGLRTEYRQEGRAFEICEVAEGYLIQTLPRYGQYISMLYNLKKAERLSRAATEILAIIAYRQPITRSSIEGIRGVDSSGTLSALLDRELIEVVGKLDAPGRPSLYGVTNRFLQHFGLKTLKDLST